MFLMAIRLGHNEKKRQRIQPAELNKNTITIIMAIILWFTIILYNKTLSISEINCQNAYRPSRFNHDATNDDGWAFAALSTVYSLSSRFFSSYLFIKIFVVFTIFFELLILFECRWYSIRVPRLLTNSWLCGLCVSSELHHRVLDRKNRRRRSRYLTSRFWPSSSFHLVFSRAVPSLIA